MIKLEGEGKVRNVFSNRRELDPPVGIPQDFIGSAIQDPDLAQLAASPSTTVNLSRDRMPIPSARDREGYYGDRHFEYWLSGLSDYIKVKEVCPSVSSSGARLLDFGGATGRIARHFYAQEDMGEVLICDININHVHWILEHLPPGFGVFKNNAIPSLPIPDDYFDVVTAFSVFTHMNENELGWLYELRRILKPNGILYTSVHNEDTWRLLPSTAVFEVLMKDEDFRASYRPDGDLTDRLVFEYSSAPAYNCNTFHPSSYIHRVWGTIFTVIGIRPTAHSYQSGVALRKELR